MSPAVLEAELPNLEGGVHQQLHPTMLYYSSKKPLAQVKSFHKRPSTLRNMSATELLQSLHETATAAAWDESFLEAAICAQRSWWYYSAPNTTTSVAVTRKHVDIQLLEQAVTRMSTGSAHVHSINLWLGGAGVTASTHYDASVNFFAQLHGSKQFILTAPAAENLLQPYSFLHPHFRRAQRPLQNSSSHWLSLAELRKGDVLFLPAFYFHEVTATSTVSISVNVWANDQFVEHVQQMQRHAASALGLDETNEAIGHRGTFDSSWPLQARAALLEHTTQEIIARTLALSPALSRSWLADRMIARWASVQRRYPQALGKLAKFCDPGMRHQRAQLALHHLRMRPAEVQEQVQARLEKTASSVASAMRALPEGAIELELGNLVEQAAFEVLGNVKITGSFLVNCFKDDQRSTQPTLIL
ncbi:hypothetical protein AB1Y20_022593 [Prymnesium parvum]|uniref:JmjC domain-containing protein n=1 Tax=Prymnesium parvum TaxID=97485 RepID=A0AB34JJA3_PRYPA